MRRSIIVIIFAMLPFMIAQNKANPEVIMKTNYGDIHLVLYQDRAPVTVQNFLRYVDAKFYDGTIFHRVIGNFMIQGGGFVPGFVEKKTFQPIVNEAANGLKNARGTVAMARTNVVNSATSQFFINVVENYPLDYQNPSSQGFGYCVFGQVTRGMEVVDRIRSVPTKTVGYFQDVPQQDVVIISVRRK